MAQQQVQKQKSQVKRVTEDAQQEPAAPNADLAARADAAVADIEEVLDELLDAEILADIDDILEANAEEFIENYVQEGGQ